MTAQSPGGWEKVRLAWRWMGGEESRAQDQRNVFSISQLKNKTASSFLHVLPKPPKSAGCFSNHILQHAARRAALLFSGTSHARGAAGPNPC